VLGILAAVSALVAADSGCFDVVTGKRSVVLYDRSFLHFLPAKEWPQPAEKFSGGWTRGSQGLTLNRGEQGSITLRVSNDHEGRLVVLLFGRDSRDFHHSVAVSGDGQHFTMVARDLTLAGGRVDLTPVASAFDTVWLRIQADADPDGSAHHGSGIAAGEFSRIRILSLKPPLHLHNPFIALLVCLAPLLAYFTRQASGRAHSTAFALLVLLGLAVLALGMSLTRPPENPDRWWEIVVASQGQDVYFLIPYAVLLAIFGAYVRPWESGHALLGTWLWFALAGILAWAGSARLAEFAQVIGAPLNPDTITYMQLVEQLSSPYETGSREPLWIWMIWAWFGMVGPSAAHIRILTVGLSLVLLLVAYKVFADYTGRPLVGIVVAALLGMNSYMISLSVRGLREEAYLICLLSFFYLVFVPHPGWSKVRETAALALAGAACLLMRFNSYLFVGPLLALWAWRQPNGRRWLALAPLVFMAIVSVPHLVHNYRDFGDPLYSVNVHFVWSRNYEFVVLKQTGCAGCPTREEFETDSTAGATFGAWTYLFGLHDTREVFERLFQGYRDMYFQPTWLFEMQSGTRSHMAFVLYLVGLGCVLASAYRETLALILLLANAVPFAISLDIDPRIGLATAPFITFVLAYGIVRSLEWTAALVNPARTAALSALVPLATVRRWERR
jgi:hypothetical protein